MATSNNSMNIKEFNNMPPSKSKRRQVKVACKSCKASCKRCDEARPCTRCVDKGIGDSCVDAERKTRQKGTIRGPYKKANKLTRSTSSQSSSSQRLPSIASLLSSIGESTSNSQALPFNTQYSSPSLSFVSSSTSNYSNPISTNVSYIDGFNSSFSLNEIRQMEPNCGLPLLPQTSLTFMSPSSTLSPLKENSGDSSKHFDFDSQFSSQQDRRLSLKSIMSNNNVL